MPRDGTSGWDEYAPFYDWENARTMARRDVPFWQRLAAGAGTRILELGCGTGRVTLPVGRVSSAPVAGIDRSAAMLTRASARLRRSRPASALALVRGDIRHLPFPPGTFDLVLAPYGILQSLLDDDDLSATLQAVWRVLEPGGRLGLELVADLPAWREYRNQTRLRGWRAGGRSHLTLIESVRQDRARQLTIFEQEFVERKGSRRDRRRFELAFRTVSLPQMVERLEAASFGEIAKIGDYEGGPWDPGSEVWILIARKPA